MGRFVTAVYGGDILICGHCGGDTGVVGDRAGQRGRTKEDRDAVFSDGGGGGDNAWVSCLFSFWLGNDRFVTLTFELGYLGHRAARVWS